VYKQEFNCNVVGYYEAAEKKFDLFRSVVACAVLFLSVGFFLILCIFLLYACIPTLAL
jgi:hypothetical protein